MLISQLYNKVRVSFDNFLTLSLAFLHKVCKVKVGVMGIGSDFWFNNI